LIALLKKWGRGMPVPVLKTIFGVATAKIVYRPSDVERWPR
jgi:hypothetical protein